MPPEKKKGGLDKLKTRSFKTPADIAMSTPELGQTPRDFAMSSENAIDTYPPPPPSTTDAFLTAMKYHDLDTMQSLIGPKETPTVEPKKSGLNRMKR